MKRTILSIATSFAMICLLSCTSNTATTTEDVQSVADSATVATDTVQADTTQIVEVADTLVEEEAIDPNDVFAAYSKYLKGESEYFTYDITGNGIPELFVKTGSFEAEYELTIYSFEDGKAKKIYNDGAGHSMYLQGNNYVVKYWAHSGYCHIDKLIYKDGKVKEETIMEETEYGYDEEYPERPEPYFVLTPSTDKRALRKALKI